MGKVLISADSGCDLFPTLYKDYKINIVPLYITMEGSCLLDGKETDADAIFESVQRTKKIPKTSAPPPSDFYASFKPYIEQGYEIVHIAMNSVFSCSYQNACIAAEEFKGVYVIDSRTISTAMGLLVLQAAEMRDNGKSAKEIADHITAVRHKPRCEFVLDTLEYAYKGGRCSVLQMFGANLLRLRPCLKVDSSGVLSVYKKFRGSFSQVALQYAQAILDYKDIDYSRVFISHTGISQTILDSVVDVIKAAGKFKDILITRCGCTISCHGGPNTLAVFYMTL